MKYVDGYVLPVPAENIEAYRAIAEKAGKIWIEHGALEYREYAGDDLAIENMPPFTSAVKTEPGDTIVFAYIVYESREHSDAINAKVMKDPRLFESCDPNTNLLVQLPVTRCGWRTGLFKTPVNDVTIETEIFAVFNCRFRHSTGSQTDRVIVLEQHLGT